MKIIRCQSKDQIFYGVAEGETVRQIKGDIFRDYTISNSCLPIKDTKVLAPCNPSKIIAIGLNYRSHAEEVKMDIPEEPMLFMKPSTAVIGPDAEIIYPAMAKRVDYEGELGVVVGKRCRNVMVADVPDVILGYTCFNDVTARDLQKKDKQFTRSKSFDTFAPMGPCIATELDSSDLSIETLLNGEKRQFSSTRDLIFPVFFLVSFISRVMTLLPGDVIATGTPSGIGPLRVGDIVEVRIEGVGTLCNSVTTG